MRASTLLSRHLHLQRHQIPALWLMQLGVHRGDEDVAGDHRLPLHLQRLEAEQPQLPDRPHDGHVPGIPQRLVLHHIHFAFVGERQGADAAPGVKRLQRAHRGGKSTGSTSLSASTWTGLAPRSTQDGVV